MEGTFLLRNKLLSIMSTPDDPYLDMHVPTIDLSSVNIVTIN